MSREAAHVHFVYDEVLQGDIQLLVAIPFEVVEMRARAVGIDAVSSGRLAPLLEPADGFGVGIEQDLLGVKTMPGRRIEGTVKAEAIFDLGGVQANHSHGIDITGAERFEKWDLDQRQFPALLEEDEAAGSGIARGDGEVDAIGHDGGAERAGLAGAKLVVAQRVAWEYCHCCIEEE